MATSFPLSLADFYDQLTVREADFDLPDSLESTTNGAGEILTADVGQRLWTGKVTLTVCTLAEAKVYNGMIEALGGAGRTFFIYDSRGPYPLDDPDGSKLDGYTPFLKSVASNKRDATLGGLPPGLKLTTGDQFGFEYRSDPVRHAVHRLFKGGTVNGSGEVGIEVTDFIRNDWAVNAPVTLIKPAVKAVLVPKSHKSGTPARNNVTGITFAWRQTLR